MSLNANAVLGIALGSSQAGGYVNAKGHITGWLNELAFVPVDYDQAAPVDEWSGDAGCGVQYFSQQAVFRLAEAAGITLEAGLQAVDKLKTVQELLARGDGRALSVFETIGVYLGYGIAHYADYYDVAHVLILGRVTSGEAGPNHPGEGPGSAAARVPRTGRALEPPPSGREEPARGPGRRGGQPARHPAEGGLNRQRTSPRRYKTWTSSSENPDTRCSSPTARPCPAPSAGQRAWLSPPIPTTSRSWLSTASWSVSRAPTSASSASSPPTAPAVRARACTRTLPTTR